MADNATLPATGTVVATDDIGGVHHQIVKPAFGTDGTATMVSAANPLPVSADAVVAALAAVLAELQLKPDVDDRLFLERVAFKALARITFSPTGARVDASGSTVLASIASNQTLSTVTSVGSVGALGRLTVDGQSIQMTQLNYTNGFRARLV
jgi:hypothetical protein